MYKHLFIVIIVCCIAQYSNSQAKEAKYWDEGKLTWEDFSVSDTSSHASVLSYHLGYNSAKFRKKEFQVTRILAYCYVDTKKSFVGSKKKTDRLLEYNQLIFDIVELHRRELQFQMDRLNSVFKGEEVFRKVQTKCQIEVKMFKKDSEKGKNIKEIKRWRELINKRLEETPDNIEAQYNHSLWGYGINLGAGANIFTGDITDYIDPGFNFQMGLNFSYGRNNLYGDLNYSNTRLKKDIEGKTIMKDGRLLGYSLITLSYGFSIIKNNRHSVTPFAGFSYTELGDYDSSLDKKESIDCYCPHIGVNYEYDFIELLKLTPNSVFGVKESLNTKIFARILVSKHDFNSDIKGIAINASVGLKIYWNRVNMKQ